MNASLPVRHLGACTVVKMPHEIDLDNAPTIREQLLQLLDSGASGLVIDMSGTTFCDSSGLSAVVHAHQRAETLGGWVRLVITDSHVRKVFTITSVDTLIPIHESLDDARQAHEEG